MESNKSVLSINFFDNPMKSAYSLTHGLTKLFKTSEGLSKQDLTLKKILVDILIL